MTQKSPSAHHRTTLSGHIFATKARIDNQKNTLSSNISSTCSHNMVNFGLLAAEIGPVVWGTPANFNGFSSLGSVTARQSSSGRQPNVAALNRGRHLYAAGRPSRWAVAHILVVSNLSITASCILNLKRKPHWPSFVHRAFFALSTFPSPRWHTSSPVDVKPRQPPFKPFFAETTERSRLHKVVLCERRLSCNSRPSLVYWQPYNNVDAVYIRSTL